MMWVKTISLPEYPEELVDFRVTVEQGSLGEHLGKYAGHTPHVNWTGVAMRAEQDLWSSIP